MNTTVERTLRRAGSVFSAYVRASGDAELWRLLDFYACYRAYVRGKVRSLRLAQLGLSSEVERELELGARAYFDLAWAHAAGLTQPMVVVTMGLPASGKTTLAHALASNLDLEHLSSDVVRKELVGIRPNERRPEPFAAGLYSPEMTERTYAALRRRPHDRVGDAIIQPTIQARRPGCGHRNEVRLP